MRKTTRKFLTVLLALCMLFSIAMPALSVSAATVASGTCGNNVTWVLDGKGTLTISGKGKMEDYEYVYAPWYDDIDKIKSIVIKDGVTSIGDEMFLSCKNLTSVTIPNSVTSIGNRAFVDCESLTKVTIPDSVTSIGENAFYNSGLTSVTIPDSVTSIRTWAFAYCKSLTKVAIPDSVTSMEDYAFYSCESLTSVVIPDSVTGIGDSAFANCESLTNVTIGDSVTDIGNYAFAWCNNLTSVTIPDSVTSIGDWAFYSCDSLTSVTIPDSVTGIGDSAFAWCNNLTSVTIPDSVTSIGSEAFFGCYGLTNITFEGNAPKIDKNSFEELMITAYYPAENSTWTESVLKDYGGDIIWVAYGATDGVVASGTCGDNVAWVLDDKGTITISGSGDMDDYDPEIISPWYDYRYKIKSVVIEDGVTSIGSFVFYECENLTSVVIPDGVTRIGECTFGDCISLTSVTIPDSVISIGYESFGYCSNLKGIWVDENNPIYSSDKYGVLFNKDKTELIMAPEGLSGKYTIPNSVTSIADFAFTFCGNLTGVTIGNSVTSIGGWAFEFCESLTSVNIPNSVTSIGSCAFNFCESLTSVTIGDSVTSIGDWAFGFCTSLTSVTIGDSVTDIDVYAFTDCENLTSIIFKGDAPNIGEGCFDSVTATAYYPAGNATWTKSVMQDYDGDITWKSYDPATPSAPKKPHKIVNTVSGVHVYWNAINGVSKYGLWRSETGKNGTYKWIANPTAAHFTDTKVESGKTYYYKVTAMNTFTGKHSAMSEAIGITYVSTPDITSRVNSASGIKLGWNKISGATGYAIYRKSYSGNDAWVRVATISGNSTFTWTDAAVKNNNGTIYKYTIRALAGSDLKTLSGCRNAGRTMVRLTSRTLNSATKASSTSIKCNWTTTSQATGYEVRFMVGDKVYKTYTIGNYKTGTKTFTGLKAGQTYKVQVRAYKKVDGVGSFYSAWSTAKNVTL